MRKTTTIRRIMSNKFVGNSGRFLLARGTVPNFRASFALLAFLLLNDILGNFFDPTACFGVTSNFF